jgi:signal transduction histidine kinase
MPDALSVGLVVLASTLALAAWRYPLPAAAVFAAGAFIPGVIIGERWWSELPNAVTVDVMGLSFVVGARLGGATAIPGLALAVLAATAGELSPGSQVRTLVFTVPAWTAGRVLRSHNQIAAQLDARGRELERERHTYEREKVRYERARIARDLHDVVGHHLSAMVVQAGAGRRAIADDARTAADSLTNIQATVHLAEQQLDDLASLAGKIEADRTTGAAGAPDSTGDQSDQLDQLVRRATAAGLQVDYSIATTTGELPPQLSQAIYFVSQEGITNALKHAAGAPIRIAIDGDETTVTVTVENGPPTRESSGLETTGGGFGLEGLRQRLRALDGSLAAGPTDNAGWRLAARLPRNVPHAVVDRPAPSSKHRRRTTPATRSGRA